MEDHSFVLGVIIGIIIGAIATMLGLRSAKHTEKKLEEILK